MDTEEYVELLLLVIIPLLLIAILACIIAACCKCLAYFCLPWIRRPIVAANPHGVVFSRVWWRSKGHPVGQRDASSLILICNNVSTINVKW